MAFLKTIRRLARHARPPVGAGGADARSTAIYIGDNRLLVGTTIGRERYAFYTEADDRLLTPWFALTGCHEANVTAFFLKHLRRDSHCLDVGSNFGYFLNIMARTCRDGHVIAVEPDRELAAIAQDNLFLNGVHERATVVRAAVADRAGEVTLHRREYRSGNTSMIAVDQHFTDYLNEPPALPFAVPSLTIDMLAERLGGRVDFIKIDVEGAEPMALAGASGTIARNPGIVIVMEWSPGQIAAVGHPVAAFVDQIWALELQAFRLVREREVPLTPAELVALPYESAVILRRRNVA
ncbi:FkbM family methyltransferase [Sphingomonas nostoxanthinifaciens]|uniref:FkbM family methyltransferase n=1 Tax=Sphingomonas nostoxanthinifaciens TaxID=2872652 RepID=UPI001CC1EEF3|nr:FkbM family methyltransferase [Sphingomonas nostoxanthinifaciens]UAK24674.1 FkbM family methyltransferase [Sphingomonas nostoxanthinifaciens]